MTVLGLGHSPLRPCTFASVNGSRALTTGAARPSNINLYIIPLSLGDCSTATNNKPLMRHGTMTTSATNFVAK